MGLRVLGQVRVVGVSVCRIEAGIYIDRWGRNLRVKVFRKSHVSQSGGRFAARNLGDVAPTPETEGSAWPCRETANLTTLTTPQQTMEKAGVDPGTQKSFTYRKSRKKNPQPCIAMPSS